MSAKTIANEHREFLWMAYCGLVLRGYDKERSITDPILRRVWRLGRHVALAKKRQVKR